jgi:hypothetical protein
VTRVGIQVKGEVMRLLLIIGLILLALWLLGFLIPPLNALLGSLLYILLIVAIILIIIWLLRRVFHLF